MTGETTNTGEATGPILYWVRRDFRFGDNPGLKAAADQQFRLYAGYAGWAPNQLDFERTRGDWHVIKADADSRA